MMPVTSYYIAAPWIRPSSERELLASRKHEVTYDHRQVGWLRGLRPLQLLVTALGVLRTLRCYRHWLDSLDFCYCDGQGGAGAAWPCGHVLRGEGGEGCEAASGFVCRALNLRGGPRVRRPVLLKSAIPACPPRALRVTPPLQRRAAAAAAAVVEASSVALPQSE